MIREISPESLVPEDRPQKQGKESGAYTFVARGAEVESVLEERYGRSGLCLKVLRRPTRGAGGFAEWPLWTPDWGPGFQILECTLAQNLFARHGLAPRVYDLVQVYREAWRYAQVTDYVTGDGEFDRDAFADVRERYGVHVEWDVNPKNVVGGKWVDFGAARPGDGYARDLVERAYERASWGSRSEPYQSVGALCDDAQRDFPHRAEKMDLAPKKFEGETVLDVGCNLGSVCRFASRAGARRVVGIDLPHVADLAYEVANWERDWNVDYVGARLKPDYERTDEVVRNLTGFDSFDFVFALSVDRQIGYGPWMARLCDDTFFLEGHVGQHRDDFEDRLDRDFETVRFRGATRDHGPRPLFECERRAT